MTWRGSWGATLRGPLLAATLALAPVLALPPLGCGALTPARVDPAPDPDRGSEPRLASALQGWFSSLESVAPEPQALDDFLAASPVDFPLTQGDHPGPGELRTWLADLRTGYPQVEYQIGAMRIEQVSASEYRARFEVETRGVDREGLPHLARVEQRWLIRELPGHRPAVRRIDERRLLAFPGTGPQIVCY